MESSGEPVASVHDKAAQLRSLLDELKKDPGVPDDVVERFQEGLVAFDQGQLLPAQLQALMMQTFSAAPHLLEKFAQ
eukprot:CAMPEP_0115077254 /NCGR_PEP_ID=MMETSP0227-20121206/16887_1 /TAXON_ID=89957 /ORGANISM="Polarella glacialis, Strain CCMP 1383" /LENGTH=76 /DNA_ID=CAMNT_0002464499 /DNA_START=61 /DNA_END=291 /DNA_ORIENTATION=+